MRQAEKDVDADECASIFDRSEEVSMLPVPTHERVQETRSGHNHERMPDHLPRSGRTSR